MFKMFCIPGRILARLFFREKKRAYRSIRSKPEGGAGIGLLSLVCWLAIAGGILFGIDKAGLLKQALDAGVEATQSNVAENISEDPAQLPANDIPQPVFTDSASGDLSGGSQAPTPSVRPDSAQGSPSHLSEQSTAEIEQQWFVILHSIPKHARNEAERRKTSYQSKGLEVDILDSDAFPLLNQNGSWWVIAQGPFSDKAKAIIASDKAKKHVTGLMIRRGL